MPNEINLFGVIGRTEDGSGITSQQVKTQLARMDQSEPLIVRIDSEGGSVFDGFSIYEAFASYAGPKKAIIESTAFSIASYIAMAFDEVEIAENGYVMIHEPSSDTSGTAGDLAKGADLLAKLDQSMVAAYSKKTGLSEDEARGLMKEETFMNASEALAFGFVNSVSPTRVQTRIAPQAKHRNMPQKVYTALFGAGPVVGDTSEPTKEKPMSNAPVAIAATIQEIKAAFPKAKAEFVLRCLEQGKPMAVIAAELPAEELKAENEELMAKISAMEEEMVALRAKAEGEELPLAEGEEEVVATEEELMAMEEEMVEARAKARAKARLGSKPIARSKAARQNVRARWHSEINARVAAGRKRADAILDIDRQIPGLREAMLAEANA